MRKSRFTEEQIIGVLREQEAGATSSTKQYASALRRHTEAVRLPSILLIATALSRYC